MCLVGVLSLLRRRCWRWNFFFFSIFFSFALFGWAEAQHHRVPYSLFMASPSFHFKSSLQHKSALAQAAFRCAVCSWWVWSLRCASWHTATTTTVDAMSKITHMCEWSRQNNRHIIDTLWTFFSLVHSNIQPGPIQPTAWKCCDIKLITWAVLWLSRVHEFYHLIHQFSALLFYFSGGVCLENRAELLCRRLLHVSWVVLAWHRREAKSSSPNADAHTAEVA